jgi:hypothetical protein
VQSRRKKTDSDTRLQFNPCNSNELQGFLVCWLLLQRTDLIPKLIPGQFSRLGWFTGE